jgi:membrane protein insertase, YidC/Oxa1 family, N-terminal domain
MDSKNVIAAISLSAAVIILYGLFFAPPPPDPKQIDSEKNNKVLTTTSDAPTLEESDEVIKVSRNEALKENKRVKFENSTIKGSISLVGSAIDDLEFKKFKEKLNGDNNVTLLNPRKVKNGYYIETGWVTTNKNINVPNSKSVWKIKGNNKLTPNSSIKLVWTRRSKILYLKK